MTKVNTATAQKTAEFTSPKTDMVLVKTEVKPAAPKEPTLDERIHKVENLQLLVTKRSKLIQTRSELERFQIGSNDFNCNMQLKDSDGNAFTTGFTPGIKKVIDFLKASFDASIQEIENKIKF
ncbi:MAG: hypothetical protein NTU51_10560 [Bacteroidetes bacterium]|nr:hypothetical protein [Bacteroidota bacterium]